MSTTTGYPSEPRATWTKIWREHGNTTLVSWHPEAVTVGGSQQAREQLLLDLHDVGKHRTRTKKPDPKALEKAGSRALTTNVSMGDERCYAGFTGLTEAEAVTSRDTTCPGSNIYRHEANPPHSVPKPQIWTERRKLTLPCPGLAASNPLADHYTSGTCLAPAVYCECGGKGMLPKPIPSPFPGWKKVTFPASGSL
jgi:hypothetical protein